MIDAASGRSASGGSERWDADRLCCLLDCMASLAAGCLLACLPACLPGLAGRLAVRRAIRIHWIVVKRFIFCSQPPGLCMKRGRAANLPTEGKGCEAMRPTTPEVDAWLAGRLGTD